MKWFILSSKAHQIDTSGTSLDTDWFLYLNQHFGILDKKAGNVWFVQDQDCWRWLGGIKEKGRAWVGEAADLKYAVHFLPDSLGASRLCSVGITHWQYWWLLCFGLRWSQLQFETNKPDWSQAGASVFSISWSFRKLCYCRKDSIGRRRADL